jgi:hypothetical protein
VTGPAEVARLCLIPGTMEHEHGPKIIYLEAMARVVLAASAIEDHGYRCAALYIDPKPCTCGHDALAAALQGKGG